MSDLEDLRIQPIRMPDITGEYSTDKISKIDTIIKKLNNNIYLDIRNLLKKNNLSISFIKLLHRYHQLVNQGFIKENKELELKLMRKKGRGHSGVEVIAVSTYPEGKYAGCPADCHYCPKEPEKYFQVKITHIKTQEKFLILHVENINPKDYYYAKVINHIYWENKKIYVMGTILIKKMVLLKFDIKDFETLPKVDDILQVYKTAQPRSYLSEEPAVSRANQNNWDCVAQFRDIAGKRIICGHNVTKVEGIVIGGTWSFYPKDYQKKFIRDFYYSANTLYDELPLRSKKSLEEELKINELSRCRVIGLTLETRPDFITPTEIKLLRSYGCTRVQLGIQHIDNKILKKINRGCKNEHSIKAIKLLKDSGFKVDIHLMPDLPGSSFWDDVKMLEYVLNRDELQADQWKIYPCQTLEYTRIKQWYEEGKYKPYFENLKIINFHNIYLDYYYKKYIKSLHYDFLILLILILNCNLLNIISLVLFSLKCFLVYQSENIISNPLLHLLVYFIPKVPTWIRLNRIVRDNPKHMVVGGLNLPNYRNNIEAYLEKINKKSQDIREREIKGREYSKDNVKFIIKKYFASEGIEYFISVEDIRNNYLLGFLRLRLPKKVNNHFLKELLNSALIRELHVYGYMVPQGNNNKIVQHQGYGQKLVKIAENIAKNNSYNKIAIISGIGVREYYNKKLGYNLEGSYMTKLLS